MKFYTQSMAVVAALLLFLSTFAFADTIAEDSKVTTEFTLKLPSGKVVATTDGKDPVTFQMGKEGMMPAVQAQMLGMEVGDSKEVTLAPAQAFGESDPKAVQAVPSSKIPENLRQVGKVVSINQQNGQTLQATVVEVGEEETTLDFNHPLAGRTVVVEVKVLKVE